MSLLKTAKYPILSKFKMDLLKVLIIDYCKSFMITSFLFHGANRSKDQNSSGRIHTGFNNMTF